MNDHNALLSIYDFDGTIYNGDSLIDFWIFTMRQYPRALLFLPYQIILSILFLVKIKSAKKLKEAFLLPLNFLDAHQQQLLLKHFWIKHKSKINPWVSKHIAKERSERCELICISASPEFLLAPIMNELQFNYLIGSIFKTNQHGQIKPVMTSENCKGIEKVNRLNASFDNNYIIHNFYSDHKSDMPLFKLAKNKFLVTDGEVKPCDICSASGKLCIKNHY